MRSAVNGVTRIHEVYKAIAGIKNLFKGLQMPLAFTRTQDVMEGGKEASAGLAGAEKRTSHVDHVRSLMSDRLLRKAIDSLERQFKDSRALILDSLAHRTRLAVVDPDL